MTTGIDKQLARLVRLYGEPKVDSLPAFYDEYRRALGGVDAELLDCAVSNVVDERTITAWPTPGEIRMAVHEIAGQRERVRYSAPSMREPEPTPEEIAQRAAMRIKVSAIVASIPTPKGHGVGWYCAACIAAAGRSISEPYRKTGAPPRYEGAGELEERPYYAGQGWCHAGPHEVPARTGLWWFRDWHSQGRRAGPLNVLMPTSLPAWDAGAPAAAQEPQRPRRDANDPDAWRDTIDDEVLADPDLYPIFTEQS